MQADSILGGKYRLIRQLDRGGMGSVWVAQHLTLGSAVAVKLMDTQIAASPEAVNRFLREAQAAAALRSPHVVQIIDYGIDGAVPYIVMELLEGESLAARLERQALSPQQTAQILTDVARALGKAHEAGIAHRDLKPENVFIIRNDDQELAKVLDFGIAKTPRGLVAALAVAPDTNTDTGALLGTPNYMSPEQAFGSKDLDYRTDIWSLGVIAFECLTGRRPFEAETVGKLLVAICTEPLPVPSTLAGVPAGFDGWFARACARSAADRFQSARDAMVELRRVCEWAPSSPVPSLPSGPHSWPQARSSPSQHPYSLTPTFNARRSRWRGAFALVLLVPLVAGLAFLAWRRYAARETAAAAETTPRHSGAGSGPSLHPSARAEPRAANGLPSVSSAPPEPSATSATPARPTVAPRPRVAVPRVSAPPSRPKSNDTEDLGI